VQPTLILNRSLSHIRQASLPSKLTGFKCGTPQLSFSLFGKSSAFSRNHLDPDGVVSAIMVETGSKIWAVHCQDADGLEAVPDLKRVKKWAKARWDAAFLEPGDTM
jgi:hypothetical protein